MKCSAFIATSVDGYIATPDGGVDWLDTAGKQDADLGEHEDMGFNDYIASTDCMIMGRKCMEAIASFNLTDEQWPYRNTRIVVLSQTLREAPDNMKHRVEMYAGELPALLERLENEGFKHAYVDGGTTLTSFLNLGLLNEITLTRAPIILGGGIPLFGPADKPIALEEAHAVAYANDFVQVKYKVRYV